MLTDTIRNLNTRLGLIETFLTNRFLMLWDWTNPPSQIPAVRELIWKMECVFWIKKAVPDNVLLQLPHMERSLLLKYNYSER